MKKQLLLVGIITLGVFSVHGQQSFNHLHAYYLTTGEDAQASGEFATALVNGQAFGDNSLAAVGAGAYGPGSVAIGEGNIANGRNQTVLGLYNLPQGNPNAPLALTDDLLIVGNGTAHNARSNALTIKRNGDLRLFGNLAFGPTAVATASYLNQGSYGFPYFSMANGPGATAHATQNVGGSFAWGHNSNATNASFAFGSSARATGIQSFALGNNAEASGYASVALGKGTKAQGYNQVVIGVFNKPQGTPLGISPTAPSYSAPAPDDHLFIIGNGRDNPGQDIYSNALTVAYNGATRINGTLTVKTKIRVAPAGDIPMGNYTSGSNPANEAY